MKTTRVSGHSVSNIDTVRALVHIGSGEIETAAMLGDREGWSKRKAAAVLTHMERNGIAHRDYARGVWVRS
jgi:hypothetical protein